MKERQCYPCNACCGGWLTATINGQKIAPGKPCVHVSEKGCGIYEKRPDNPCRVFECGWLKNPEMPDHMRPSECGAIVLLDNIWNGQQIIRAIPIGEKIPGDTLEWLMAYSREQNIPLAFSEHVFKNGKFKHKKRLGYGPPSFIEAVKLTPGPEDIF